SVTGVQTCARPILTVLPELRPVWDRNSSPVVGTTVGSRREVYRLPSWRDFFRLCGGSSKIPSARGVGNSAAVLLANERGRIAEWPAGRPTVRSPKLQRLLRAQGSSTDKSQRSPVIGSRDWLPINLC